VVGSGYNRSEAALGYYRDMLKGLRQEFGNQHPVIKDVEAKIKYLEKWSINDSDRGPFTVSEHVTLDDIGLSTSCWNKTGLTKHLTRLHRDESAPKEIMIIVSKSTRADRLSTALKAIYDAGYQNGRIYLHPEVKFTLTGAEMRKEGDLKLLECRAEDFSKLTVTPNTPKK
jgi:hypothetical protein